MVDFFISYTSTDRNWAEWIGYVLEEEGFSIIIQAWDFRPGSNFVLEMNRAAAQAKRTVMVLSPDYLRSQFTSPEWAAAFVQDPQGLRQSLVPILVRECQVDGLLRPLIHMNLIGKDEDAAREILLAGVKDGRAKPSRRPKFPGSDPQQAHKAFPGPASLNAETSDRTYMPNIRKVVSDVEKRRFLRQAFETIRDYFDLTLRKLTEHEPSIEGDFQSNTATDFSVEIFLEGKSRCRCRIRQGAMLRDESITYSEGKPYSGDNSFNEMLSIESDNGELYLASIMGSGFGKVEGSFNLKKMTQEQAAEYLWRRFLAPLER